MTEFRGLAALEKLRSEWNDLYLRCPNATPFQSPHWLIPWARHLAEGDVWMLAVYDHDRLVALLPLFTWAGGQPPERQLFLLGIGNTDYLDLLAESGYEDSAVALIFASLEERQDDFDVCDFQELRPGSPLLATEAPENWSSELMVQEVCPVLPLAGAGADLLSVIPKHMFEKLTYYRRRAARHTPMSIEAADSGSLDDLFTAFLLLHAARWRERGQPGVMRDETLQQFHREVCRELLNAAALRLYALRIRGRIVACLYAFAGHARTFHYLAGFDPEFSSLSPGSLLIGHAIERALAEGHREFDFLRGRETYKYLWGAKGRLNCRRRLRPRGAGKPLSSGLKRALDQASAEAIRAGACNPR